MSIHKDKMRFKVNKYLSALWLLLVVTFASGAIAQGVLINSRVGTIQDLNSNEGEITISGVIYKLEEIDVEIRVRGENIDSDILRVGMAIRFTANGSDITVIEVLGPIEMIEDYFNH